MSRGLHLLKVKQVEAAGPGRLSDGGGLYLDRDRQGRSRWVFMYTQAGKGRREMGLGKAGPGGVSLPDARAAAEDARKLLAKGLDPIEERRNAEAALEAGQTPRPTFGEVADQLIAAHETSWAPKHTAQWRRHMEVYAASLRSRPVEELTTEDVLAVLMPLWAKLPITAALLRGRIERVLDAAKARGLRSGQNVAAWRGHMAHLLPSTRSLHQAVHYRAMDYEKVPAFLIDLQQRSGVTPRLLEFQLLTAVRPGEARGARWSEIDLGANVWTIPGARMKKRRVHRVPLSDAALDVLEKMKPLAEGPDSLVFPGAKPGRTLTSSAVEALLNRRMKVSVDAHGFRSAFRDWTGDATSFPREVAEEALAHLVGDETERAYRRSDGLERRRGLMVAWAAFVTGQSADLLDFNEGRRRHG